MVLRIRLRVYLENLNKFMNKRRKRTLILLVLLLHCQVYGQVVDTSLLVREVLITGYGNSVAESRTPGIVNTISASRLNSMPLQSVDAALDMLPGVNSNRTSGLSQMVTTVSLRALGGDEQGRTLVLMDGVPVNTSDNGTVNWNSIFSNNIARIEILRGGASAMYGANAIGGVINIVTKRPAERFSVRGEVGYGSMNSWKGNLALSSRLSRNFSFFLGGNYNRTDGYINLPDSLVTPFTHPIYMHEYGILSKLLYTPNDKWELELAYNLYRDKRGEGEKILAPDGEYRRFNNDRVLFRAATDMENWRMAFATYYQRERYFKLDERMSGDSYQRFDVRADRSDMGVMFNSSVDIGNNRIGAGVELRSGSVDGGDFYQTSSDSVINRGDLDLYSIYLRDEQSLFENRLWLQFVLRYDLAQFSNGEFIASGNSVASFSNYNGKLSDNSWHKFSPNFSIRYTPVDKFTTYFTYGRGFRASILDDLCRSGWMWVGPKIANPELGPEYLDNIEWGMTLRLGRFTFDRTIYYGIGRDFLYYIPTGEKMYGKRDIFIRKNISKVRLYGAESGITYENGTSLYMNLNFTYAVSKIVEADGLEHLRGKQLTYSPKYVIKFNTIWSGRVGEASFKASYKSKQYCSEDNTQSVDGFVMCDLSLAKWLMHKRLYLKGEVLNLFDRRVTNSPDYLAPGRMFNLKLALSI